MNGNSAVLSSGVWAGAGAVSGGRRRQYNYASLGIVGAVPDLGPYYGPPPPPAPRPRFAQIHPLGSERVPLPSSSRPVSPPGSSSSPSSPSSPAAPPPPSVLPPLSFTPFRPDLSDSSRPASPLPAHRPTSPTPSSSRSPSPSTPASEGAAPDTAAAFAFNFPPQQEGRGYYSIDSTRSGIGSDVGEEDAAFDGLFASSTAELAGEGSSLAPGWAIGRGGEKEKWGRRQWRRVKKCVRPVRHVGRFLYDFLCL